MDTDAPTTIHFAGRAWTVKTSDAPVGPGPNVFSAANVTVTGTGHLRLAVGRSPSQPVWTCAEVIAHGTFGYGTYRWTVASDLTTLDPQVVLGMFTWSDDPAQAHRELDIEFSRWGRTPEPGGSEPGSGCDPETGGFTVQTPGGPITHTFTTHPGRSEHSLMWTPGRIRFSSRCGNVEHIWTHESANVPTPGGGVAPRINLWLYRGAPAQAPASITIESFRHQPWR